MSKWITGTEYGKILGLNRRTIYGRGETGQIKRKKTSKGYLYLYEEEKKQKVNTDFFLQEEVSGAYTFDKEKSVYIFYALPGQKGPVSVSKEKIEALVWDYSNHTGGLSVNEVCRKYGISRPALIGLLRCLGKTHDSTPFTDEELAEGREDALAESLLRAKEHRVLVKAEKAYYRQVTDQAEKYGILDKIIMPRLEQMMTERSAPSPITLDIKHRANGTHAVVIGLTDLHVGKRGVCGWDMEKAKSAAVETCLESMKQAIEKWGVPALWILPCGSDMIHVDNYLNTTTKGTSQDVDGDPVDMLMVAFTLLEQIVEGLRASAPVKVVAIPGNHDRVLGLSVGLMLKARFDKDWDISVEIGKDGTVYHRHGNSLLGFNHGDMISPKDLPALMSSDQSEAWGECKGSWEWFTGHWHGHKVRADEYNGCRVWTMPSLSGTDRWHKLKGYSHNRRQVALYRVDEEGGVGGVEFVWIKGLT